MEDGEYLYLSTNDFNQAHKQIRENSHIQIIAKKAQSREWIRITGTATECDDPVLKQKMYNEIPILKTHYDSFDNEHFLMIQVKMENIEIK